MLTLPIHFFYLFLYYYPDSRLAHQFDRWKIQPHERPAGRLANEVVWKILLNHLVISPQPTSLVFVPIAYFTGMRHIGPFPTLPRLLLELAFCCLVTDKLQYASHRFLHSSPSIYKRFHAQHHRFFAPISWASEYAHPLELMISNDFPTTAGAILLRTHLFVACLWILIRMHITVDAHCGFSPILAMVVL